MNKTVTITLWWNNDDERSRTFIESFRNDFSLCLNRFKVDPKFVDGNETSDFILIAVSQNDLQNAQFIEKCNLLEGNPQCSLLILNPISQSTSSIEQHKWMNFLFFDQLADTGEVRFFRGDNKSTRALYWERVTDIAVEITERLFNHNGVKQKRIFLAQTDNSQISDRDNLKRDLNDLGYDIVPSTMLSNNLDKCTAQINEALQDVDLIIHLVPAAYTPFFPEKTISVVELQTNLSAKYISENKKTLKRIIWIPSDYDVTDEENQIFIEKIQRDTDQSVNSLILKVNLEDLKKIYRKMLTGDDVAKVSEEPLPDVYLIADNENSSGTGRIDISGASKDLRVGVNYKGISYNQHLQYLANAQVVVVNYSTENQPWINVKVNDILKSPGLETSRPIKKLILVKSSPDLDTSHFEDYFNEIHVVKAEELKLDLANS